MDPPSQSKSTARLRGAREWRPIWHGLFTQMFAFVGRFAAQYHLCHLMSHSAEMVRNTAFKHTTVRLLSNVADLSPKHGTSHIHTGRKCSATRRPSASQCWQSLSTQITSIKMFPCDNWKWLICPLNSEYSKHVARNSTRKRPKLRSSVSSLVGPIRAHTLRIG